MSATYTLREYNEHGQQRLERNGVPAFCPAIPPGDAPCGTWCARFEVADPSPIDGMAPKAILHCCSAEYRIEAKIKAGK